MLDACADERDRMLLELLWQTGGRVSEVLAARVGDITPAGLKLPNLKQSVSAQKHVFLNPEFLGRLRAYVRGRRPNDPIVSRRLDPSRGISRQMAYRIVTRAGVRANIVKRKWGGERLRPPWPHSFRHANAIHLVESGVPVNAVSEQLGHATLRSTAVYLRLADSHRQALLASVKF